MSLLAGSVTLRRFLVLGPVPTEEGIGDCLAAERFHPFEDGLEEERLGWVDWRNPLIIPADPTWCSQERFAVFTLRIDSRKIPATILKAHVDLRIQALMREKDIAFVGKEARISLADEVRVELLRKVMPTPRLVECAWDLKGGVLWSTASSSKTQGALTALFMKSFGCELQPLAPLLMAGRLVPEVPTEGLMALDPLNLEVEE